MNITFIKQSLVVMSIAVLTACGGGSSNATDAALVTSQTQNAAPKTMADAECFTLTQGKKWILNDGYQEEVVQEAFNGQNAFGIRETYGGTFSDTIYWTSDGVYARYLGSLDNSGSNHVITGEDIPLSMVPGQTASMTYTDVRTPAPSEPSPIVTSRTSTSAFTFVGFEDVVLSGYTYTQNGTTYSVPGGYAFHDTCKISSPNQDDPTKTDYIWFAKGFGSIRTFTVDVQGNEVPGSRREVVAVIVAP